MPAKITLKSKEITTALERKIELKEPTLGLSQYESDTLSLCLTPKKKKISISFQNTTNPNLHTTPERSTYKSRAHMYTYVVYWKMGTQIELPIGPKWDPQYIMPKPKCV